MRLALSINGERRVVASLPGPGYLSAHINLHDAPQKNEFMSAVQLIGFQTLTSETVRVEWPSIALHTNDAAEVRVLDSGEGDPPSRIQRSSESPTNLFTSVELARELVTLVSDFESRLFAFVRTAEQTQPIHEQKKLSDAVGHVICELGNAFLYPVYRRHQELVPDDLKGELL